ncbi:MAG: molybdopterin-synthase adenylyltransferase MoeB, partial [Chloroflexi bacterium]|nr:molybdopterin-synthase adenylyltransferase MoeB [Chloroflexota bacterium]
MATTTRVRTFTPEQVQRYSRHIIMPQVGSVGQRKLMNASALVVGAGGLGSPLAMYLAAAGIGTLGIVDFDTVDITNLQRQLLHRNADVGRLKVDSAADTIRNINPDVNVVKMPIHLNSSNVMDIIKDYDILIDGTDNFPTRYMINDAAVLAGKPVVHGSIFMFDGQATTFLPGKGCYRCLYPAPPPPGMVPSCSEAGVLGVLPGIIGSVMAIETIKLILGAGKTLANRLLMFDA